MTITIRPATPKDIPFILTGNNVIDQSSALQSQRGLGANNIHEDIFSERPKAYIDIATLINDAGEEEQAAFLIYSFFYLASEGSAIWVSKFYIDPFCRKMNIGLQMRDYLFRRYPDCPSIFGCVGVKNRIARVFFAAIGAQRYDDFPLYGVKRN
ncbi:MAG: hypothetical protein JWM96_299 [Alphaproteobacteria bacterium]|nr:hypothetical protein [Alphaproteobacteria bacterium]